MNGSKTEGVAGVEEECGRQPQAVTHSYSRSTICAENMSHTNSHTHTHRDRRPLALVMVMYSRRHGMPTHRSDNLVARRRRKRKVVLSSSRVSSGMRTESFNCLLWLKMCQCDCISSSPCCGASCCMWAQLIVIACGGTGPQISTPPTNCA